MLAWFRVGVTLHEFLLDEFKGSRIGFPFRGSKFSGEIDSNGISAQFEGFVRSEIPWYQVRTADGSRRPGLIQALSVEPTKPRLIYDARPLDKHYRHAPFHMDSVGTLTQVAWQSCYQGSLDDRSG